MTYCRPMRETVSVWLASVATTFVAVGILLLSATIWWPYAFVTRLEIAAVNTPRAGGDLVVRVDYCKPEEAAPRNVRWTLINDVTIVLDHATTSLPAGCRVTTMVFGLSPQVPAGRYRIQVESLYEPWPWRRLSYLARSVPFEITR